MKSLMNLMIIFHENEEYVRVSILGYRVDKIHDSVIRSLKLSF